ncbi:MAG: hypothetical protein Q9167_007912, partial [Letrouitia subvulpina]
MQHWEAAYRWATSPKSQAKGMCFPKIPNFPNHSSSGAGKTQILLILLLSAQLASSHNDLSRPSVYISTEHSLPTPRLAQLLRTNPLLSSLPPNDRKPSLAKIFTLQTPDLESQDHILTYQLPVLLARHRAALVVIDSIAANYRAERSDAGPNNGAAMAARAAQLVKLGAQLRDMARTYDCAIVVSNQVADRFASASPPPAAAAAAAAAMRSPTPIFSPSSSSSQQRQQQHRSPAWAGTPAGGESIDAVLMGLASPPPPAELATQTHHPAAAPAVTPSSTSANLLTLDHQMNFFTGWSSASAAASPSEALEQQSQSQKQNLKTPSLGLVWANQIACRIALVKSRAYGSKNDAMDTSVGGGRGVREDK